MKIEAIDKKIIKVTAEQGDFNFTVPRVPTGAGHNFLEPIRMSSN